MIVTTYQVTAELSQQLSIYDQKAKCKDFAGSPCIICFLTIKLIPEGLSELLTQSLTFFYTFVLKLQLLRTMQQVLKT